MTLITLENILRWKTCQVNKETFSLKKLKPSQNLQKRAWQPKTKL